MLTFDDLFILILFVLFFSALFFTWFFVHKAKTKERLLLIEKGMEPTKLKKEKTFNFPWLKIGIVLLCGSIGVFLGGIIEYQDFFTTEVPDNRPFYKRSILESGSMISLLFMYIFGAIGMILAHYLGKNKGDK